MRKPADRGGNSGYGCGARKAPSKGLGTLDRLPALARGNGGIQHAARRALIALGTASTSDVMGWTCARKRRRRNDDCRHARRALEQIGAVRVGRASMIGRPHSWRLRLPHDDRESSS
jgi:hypothetical protein